ncbi:MAG: hypothetical protein EON59_17595, partial [Alphaproteobacteria bacterium]
VPDYYRRFIDPPDIAVFKTAPIDADGNFNFGPNTSWRPDLVCRRSVDPPDLQSGILKVHLNLRGEGAKVGVGIEADEGDAGGLHRGKHPTHR